jgi:transcriptional regulator with XRE-family HTH domain
MVMILPHITVYIKEEHLLNLSKETAREDAMFGEFIKALRIERDIGLREFCRRLSIDASNWSKIERGVLAPPQDDEKLEQIAGVLNIKRDSELYMELKDKAAVDAGIIPKDLLTDQETLNSLPMFFRTVRSEKPTPEELDKLIEKIRRGG